MSLNTSHFLQLASAFVRAVQLQDTLWDSTEKK